MGMLRKLFSGNQSAKEKQIVKTIDMIDKSGYKDKLWIAFDEWNLRGWHHPWHGDPRKPMDIAARDKNDLNETYTMADAVFSACFLNSCLRHSDYVKMANMSPVVNTRGPLFVHPTGIVKRTTYHVLYLYTHLLEPYIAGCQTSSETFNENNEVNVIDAVVTCSKDQRKFALSIVNKHPEKEIKYFINMPGLPASLDATILTGDSENAYNDIDNPNRVVPVNVNLAVEDGWILLKPHSVYIIRFSL